jgi:hypothetical protein
MLLDLNSALANVQHELADAREKQERLNAYIESLQAEAHGLELALARHSGEAEVRSASNGEATRWKRLARTDAILAVLEEVDTAMGPADITKALHSKGRDDKRDHVAAALAYLKRKGRVEHEEFGKWTVRGSEAQRDLGVEGGDAP